MTKADPVKLAAAMGQILDGLAIRYVIGGSVASGLLGEPRSTFDVDLMAQLSESQAQELVRALGARVVRRRGARTERVARESAARSGNRL